MCRRSHTENEDVVFPHRHSLKTGYPYLRYLWNGKVDTISYP